MMNSKIFPAAVTAVVGFALGWAVKPAGRPGDQDAGGSAMAKDGSSLNGGIPDRERPQLILPKKAGDRPDGSGTEIRSEVRQSTADMVKSAEFARVQRLSEALGMNSEQEREFTDLSKKLHLGFKDLSRSGKSPADLLQEAALAQSEYDDSMKKLLDPEQLKAFDAFKERKKQNEIENNAQTVLGDIGGNADLSPEQRQAVLDKLRETAKKSYDARPPGYDLMAENYSVMGTNFAVTIDNAGAAFTEPGVADDPVTLQKRLQEQQAVTAKNRISLLQGILTPAQLSQYKSALDSRLNISKSFQVPSSQKP
ncbi:MAG: hypothetical protein JWO82_1441 [Akkermansiaceae bacterium]|nr:hypothetical protein [Akkermansiaceae bacterium]